MRNSSISKLSWRKNSKGLRGLLVTPETDRELKGIIPQSQHDRKRHKKYTITLDW